MRHLPDTEALVVGGGPVGLSLAIELGLRGIATTLIERESKRGVAPRAKTLNVRSLEHMRRWGIADAVRRASPLPPGLKTDIVFLTSLYGHHITTITDAFFGGQRSDERFNEPGEWIPQYVVEGVLREKASSLDCVTILDGTALDSFEQGESGVDAVLVDSAGDRIAVAAQYLVGADGARSHVRSLIGARMEGEYAYAANYNLVLRIPALGIDPPKHPAIMYWTINDRSPAVMGPMDKDNVWYFGVQLPEGTAELSPDEVRGYVVAAIGRQVDVEILSVDPWLAHSLIADQYRDRRVFLAGDACHLHPPFGGYGMNMGIGDAVDLGWKLSATLRGWGSDALLDSYEAERRPVHIRTVDESVTNYSTLSASFLRGGINEDSEAGNAARGALASEILATKSREFRTLGVVLGYSYAGSPIVSREDALPIITDAEDYQPSAAPGSLAPHLWLEGGESLYDLFGAGFTLLLLADRPDAVVSFVGAADRLGVPLTVVRVEDPRATALYQQACVLIRPDQHVAWRGDDVDAQAAIDIVGRSTGNVDNAESVASEIDFATP